MKLQNSLSLNILFHLSSPANLEHFQESIDSNKVPHLFFAASSFIEAKILVESWGTEKLTPAYLIYNLENEKNSLGVSCYHSKAKR